MDANLKFLCQVAVHEVSFIRIFGNSIMYKMSFFFFFQRISWMGVLSSLKTFVIFFSSYLDFFSEFPYFALLPDVFLWKNQTPNAFSASGGLGYANLSWIAEELITLAYSSHTKETDLSSLPPVCLLRNCVLGWQYKAKWREKNKTKSPL